MSLRTVPTPPVLPESKIGWDTVQPYPLKWTLDMSLEFAAIEWDELPWWRRTLARWLTGRDWGRDLRSWAKFVPLADGDRHHVTVLRSRAELEAMFGEPREEEDP